MTRFHLRVSPANAGAPGSSGPPQDVLTFRRNGRGRPHPNSRTCVGRRARAGRHGPTVCWSPLTSRHNAAVSHSTRAAVPAIGPDHADPRAAPRAAGPVRPNRRRVQHAIPGDQHDERAAGRGCPPRPGARVRWCADPRVAAAVRPDDGSTLHRLGVDDANGQWLIDVPAHQRGRHLFQRAVAVARVLPSHTSWTSALISDSDASVTTARSWTGSWSGLGRR